MRRRSGPIADHAKAPMISGIDICAQGVEADSASSANFGRSETVFGNTVVYRAGLTSTQLTRFCAKIQRSPQCWLWTGTRVRGRYGHFHAGRWADGRADVRYAHRVMYELLYGPIPAGLYVLHACDVPACVNPAHLFLGTQHDNLMDASRKGRLPATRRPRAYTPDVLRHALTLPPRKIAAYAREQGVSFYALAAAVRRARRREHVQRRIA